MLQDRTWLLIGRKMANEASHQELKELEDILRANPELHFSMQAIADLWQQIPSHDTHELEAAYQKHLSRMRSSGTGLPSVSKSPKFNRKIFAAAAALIIIIAGISYFTLAPTSKPIANAANSASSEISTRYGSKTNILLPDGTKVWLNAGSKLTYNKSFGENYRDVVLTGEAYFDVTHNAEKPFVIHTRSMDIKVLGTEFNVKSYPDDKTTEASLIRGSIEVVLKNHQADKIILRPNEKLVVTNDKTEEPLSVPGKKNKAAVPMISVSHLNYFSMDSTILETSWLQNRLVFEDESFAEIGRRMSRWYGVSFGFKGEDLENLRFTGNFQNETVVEALQAMQITARFRFKIVNKTILIYNFQND
jgi:transmembrane sensor